MEKLHAITIESAVANLRITASGRGIRSVRFVNGHSVNTESENPRGMEHAARAAELLRKYLSGERVRFDVPLDFSSASDFQIAVWRACSKVKHGETCSYSELAEMAGYPGAARAAGSAMAANRIAIIVPCHRVIKASGETGNYGYGRAMKEQLLGLEGVQLEGGRVTSGQARRF